MEFAAGLTTIRTQLCIVVTGASGESERATAWTPGAQEFLRRMHRHGLQITIVGPRPPFKLGSKKTVRYLERYEVVTVKHLEAASNQRLEFRLLNPKSKAWTRLRAEACVSLGPYGVWPEFFENWTSPGTISLGALWRWLTEFKRLPGHSFAFLGSSNQVVRAASLVLDRGAAACHVIEPGSKLKCWRAHRDRFLSKGGRILVGHSVLRAEVEAGGLRELRLSGSRAQELGKLVIAADTVVLSPVNDTALNDPGQWKKGLFYVHRRNPIAEYVSDEEKWLDRVDWNEAYWRVARLIGIVDRPQAAGGLKIAREERRRILAYRKDRDRFELGYSGKILDRATLERIQISKSVPRVFDRPRPVASLECLEDVACRACADACPENAIDIAAITDQPRLIEDRCTGCGACVAACPASAAVMVRDLSIQQKAKYFLPDDGDELWKAGQSVQLLNRRGEVLGSAKVSASSTFEGGVHRVLEVEATNIHVWEARGFRKPPVSEADDLRQEGAPPPAIKHVWVKINGARRLCPGEVPITVALWQLGHRRFADALFCADGSCRLCEVVVDGTRRLACSTLVRDGQEISYEAALSKPVPVCPCSNVSMEEYRTMLGEGGSVSVVRELLGLGRGTCHGRWCLGSAAIVGKQEAPGPEEAHACRPTFAGYEASPWRDIWASDAVEIAADADTGESGADDAT